MNSRSVSATEVIARNAVAVDLLLSCKLFRVVGDDQVTVR